MNDGDLKVPCPLQVRIQDVQLHNIDGSKSLMADPGSTVTACTDPEQNALAFTEAMYDRWANFTQHQSSNLTDGVSFTDFQTYPAANKPLIGSLTIVLDNGYITVIPHYELVSQERGTDAGGKHSIINPSMIQAEVSTGSSDYGINIPILGGVFLSQNYLFIDYDNA